MNWLRPNPAAPDRAGKRTDAPALPREIEMGKYTDHANIARTLSGGEIDGINYIAMEHVPGRSLQRLVGLGGRIPVGDAVASLRRCGCRLAASSRTECHPSRPETRQRDGDARGGAKLLDLGLALVLGEPLPDDPRIVGGKGYILGTMDYIAPEQARNATDVGPHSDLYSLGCAVLRLKRHSTLSGWYFEGKDPSPTHRSNRPRFRI